MRHSCVGAFLLLFCWSVVNPLVGQQMQALRGGSSEPFDIIIRGGKVMDGTGNPWFYADVGIRDGRIVAMGQLPGAQASRTIEAMGRLVVPGFIDTHSHAEKGLMSDDARRRAATNLVATRNHHDDDRKLRYL